MVMLPYIEILQSKHPRNELKLIGFKADVDTEL